MATPESPRIPEPAEGWSPPLPEAAGFEHFTVETPGLRTHVAALGAGEPLVLLHGFPQHWWQWRTIAPLLAERYRVICPDLRGAGWTEADTVDVHRETRRTSSLTTHWRRSPRCSWTGSSGSSGVRGLNPIEASLLRPRRRKSSSALDDVAYRSRVAFCSFWHSPHLPRVDAPLPCAPACPHFRSRSKPAPVSTGDDNAVRQG